jgi:hypothetical protein
LKFISDLAFEISLLVPPLPSPSLLRRTFFSRSPGSAIIDDQYKAVLRTRHSPVLAACFSPVQIATPSSATSHLLPAIASTTTTTLAFLRLCRTGRDLRARSHLDLSAPIRQNKLYDTLCPSFDTRDRSASDQSLGTRKDRTQERKSPYRTLPVAHMVYS